MRSFFLFQLVLFFFFPALSIAQEDKGYVETVAWWNGVVQELQPYREQLQSLYAETEAGLQFNRNKIEVEFRKRLVRDFPGSNYFASMGGTWQVNGYTALGYDTSWHIHKLIQKFGSLTKSYDFKQNVFTVSEGQNKISIKLDLNRPQRSSYGSAVIPALAVTAEQIWQNRSSRATYPGPLTDILNDVYAYRFAGGGDLRMDVLAEKMVVDEATRRQVLAMAKEVYSDSAWQSTPSRQPVPVGNLLPQLFQQSPQGQPRFNPLAFIPWYFWFALFGLGVLKVLAGARGISTTAKWILPLIKRTRVQDRSGEFSMGGKRETSKPHARDRTSEPAAEDWNVPDETAVPQEWSLEVLTSLEWKRFETVCAEYLRLIDFEPKETCIGADGGVDIRVYKQGRETPVFIVQCKAWKAYKVGVKPVRELFGVMAAEGVTHGKFITSGEFTSEAVAFVEGKKLKLISGKMFLASIRKLSAEKQKDLLEIAVSGDYRTPTCPQCGMKMILRQGQGRDFWGCSKYPRCKATLVYPGLHLTLKPP